ncbi:MAG: NAD-dependent protein deacetylase [Wenzhouxiangella sp.]
MSGRPLIRVPQMRAVPERDAPPGDLARLADFIDRHRRLLVLTGAGLSTGSGIPAYRDAQGQWLRRDPILYHDFIASSTVQRRYWARSFLGWQSIRNGRANAAHHALARLEQADQLALLVTQNVDGLHAQAGSQALVEVHGSLWQVSCLGCHARFPREAIQAQLLERNPDWRPEVLEIRPDGDAELDARAYPGFEPVACTRCGGVLKPDVVFFGESVPAERHQTINQALDECDALLVIGSSLVVMSGYRIVRQAHQRGLPVAAVNNGRTRADDLLNFKVGGDCVAVLSQLSQIQ